MKNVIVMTFALFIALSSFEASAGPAKNHRKNSVSQSKSYKAKKKPMKKNMRKAKKKVTTEEVEEI